MWLLECPKAPVSEHPLEVKVLKDPKHCSSLYGTTFLATFHWCQTKSDVYHASSSDLKCEEHLLRRWRPITCILVMIERNSCNKFQRNYLQHQKYFLELLLNFWKLHKISSILKKNITFITSRFPDLLVPKNVVTWMRENSCFRTPFGSKCVKGSQTLLKSPRQLFYVNFSFMWNKVSCVSCLLVGCEMWGPPCKTLMADQMYCCHDREQVPQEVPTQLSWKRRTISWTFIAFLKSP